jgi:hypothetical protein
VAVPSNARDGAQPHTFPADTPVGTNAPAHKVGAFFIGDYPAFQLFPGDENRSIVRLILL